MWFKGSLSRPHNETLSYNERPSLYETKNKIFNNKKSCDTYHKRDRKTQTKPFQKKSYLLNRNVPVICQANQIHSGICECCFVAIVSINSIKPTESANRAKQCCSYFHYENFNLVLLFSSNAT